MNKLNINKLVLIIAIFAFLGQAGGGECGEWEPADWNSISSGLTTIEELAITEKTYAKAGSSFYKAYSTGLDSTGQSKDILQKSDDNGNTWTTVFAPYTPIRSVDAVSSDIYVSYGRANIYTSGGNYYLSMSKDGGSTWTQIAANGMYSIHGVTNIVDDVYYLGVCNKVYNLTTGEKHSVSTSGNCASRIESNGFALFVLSWDDVYESLDGAVTWQKIGDGFEDIYVFNSELYGLTEKGAVFKYVFAINPVGNLVTSDLWIGAVINTEEKGPIEGVWQKGGEDTTFRGDRVIWGHFYASANDVTWGSQDNPDLFVKIWFDVSGRVDVNYFHVSVPDIEVYSDYPYDGIADEQGTTTMSRRYIRQYYENGQSYSDESYEDGNPPPGYFQIGNPSGYSTINDLRIGAMINTVEKGPVDAIWQLGGQDITSRGDQVVWGHFYASPSDVTWGSQNNPDLFMKIWFDVSGRVDVNFFHVSVPHIEVYSDLPDDGNYDQKGTTIMDNRYIRHEY